MNRREAIARANAVCAAEFPDLAGEYPSPPADPPPVEPPAATEPGDADHLAGLGEIPADWPSLPDNASLQAEASWVQANRVRVRDGNRVDLSRATAPAPSLATLSWLETAILFPSKWADVTVKATQHQADDQEATRREKGGLLDVRSLLDDMVAT